MCDIEDPSDNDPVVFGVPYMVQRRLPQEHYLESEVPSDESESKISNKLMRFDPLKWTFVSKSQVILKFDPHELEVMSEEFCYLFTNDDQSVWLEIIDSYFYPVDAFLPMAGPRVYEYRHLDEESVIAWFTNNHSRQRISLTHSNSNEILPENIASFIEDSKPRWDSEERKLYFSGKEITNFSSRAKNCTKILSSFQEESWPHKVFDPLSAGKLHDTVKTLNKKQKLICFKVTDGGQSVLWEFSGSSQG